LAATFKVDEVTVGAVGGRGFGDGLDALQYAVLGKLATERCKDCKLHGLHSEGVGVRSGSDALLHVPSKAKGGVRRSEEE